jgi:hypothetical protein
MKWRKKDDPEATSDSVSDRPTRQEGQVSGRMNAIAVTWDNMIACWSAEDFESARNLNSVLTVLEEMTDEEFVNAL